MNGLRTSLAFCCLVIGAISQSLFSGSAVLAIKLSATALVMGGTTQILSIPPSSPEYIRDYVTNAYNNFISPTGMCVGGTEGCLPVAVYTPEQLGFLTGWNDLTLDESVAVGKANLNACIQGNACIVTLPPYTTTGPEQLTDTSFVVTGQSQSAIIASEEKSYLIAHPPADNAVSFVLLSNPNRPNGGFLERFVGAYIPVLGITFNGATVTNSPQPTPLMTSDFAQQYDGWCDFPTNPLNLIADLNALLGSAFLHGNYQDVTKPAQLQGLYQDTAYYLHSTPLLPLLTPMSLIPVIGVPLALTLDAPLRVLVETGYDRTINPGQPTPAQYLYFPNPITTLANLALAVPTGWDDAISYLTGNPITRPFGTAPQPVYGVGGPPVYAGAVDPYLPSPKPDAIPGATVVENSSHTRNNPSDKGIRDLRNTTPALSEKSARSTRGVRGLNRHRLSAQAT